MNIESIGSRAVTVATAAEARDAAVADETRAEAELLAATIAAAGPALKALSSRIKISGGVVGMGDVNRQRTLAPEYYELRGLYLAADKPGPEEDNPRDSSGGYEGVDHFLLTDGTILELEYEGAWSRWQGSTSKWTAKSTILTPLEYATRWDVEPAIAAISNALDGQLKGNSEKRTKAAEERAAKLRAIVALLGRG